MLVCRDVQERKKHAICTRSSLLRCNYSPVRTFDSVVDFTQSALLFDFFFYFVILYLLISVCCYPNLSSHILFHRLGLFHSVCSKGHGLGCQTVGFFYGESLSVCRPTSNLDGQSTVYITPRKDGLDILPGNGNPFW